MVDNGMASWASLTKAQHKDMRGLIEMWRSAADHGHAGAEAGAAQFILSNVYFYGHGVKQDCAKALRWNRQAAERGHAGAQCSLGVGFFKGQGVKQDHAAAAQWYRKAADQ